LLINGLLEVDPAALELDVRLIHAPGLSDGRGVLPPAFLKHGQEALHPSRYRGMSHGEPPLGHHLYEVSVAQRVAHVPSDAQNNDELIEASAFEEVTDVVQRPLLSRKHRQHSRCPNLNSVPLTAEMKKPSKRAVNV
jgi:hypothetical protein